MVATKGLIQVFGALLVGADSLAQEEGVLLQLWEPEAVGGCDCHQLPKPITDRISNRGYNVAKTRNLPSLSDVPVQGSATMARDTQHRAVYQEDSPATSGNSAGRARREAATANLEPRR